MNRRRSVRSIPVIVVLLVAVAATLSMASGSMAKDSGATHPVNINTADAGELTSLPGIGASKASAIVNYRSEHGNFNSVDELTKVQGIGGSVLEKIRDLITTQ